MQPSSTEGKANMIRVGVIGYGYWGPNIVRNFQQAEGSLVVAICDKSDKSLRRAHQAYPGVRVSSEADDLLTAVDIDAIAVVTPVWTHFELAKRALENGKHVFVEKPFTSTVAQAEELIELAERKKLKIMVDHTFLFTGAVRRIRQLIDSDTLGHLYYYDSTRVNLGLFQHDVNVIWDLAPHDLSIMDYLCGQEPIAISATGVKHLNTPYENVAYVTVHFEGNFIAHFHLNWLAPVKVRRTLVGGSKKMIVYDDMENSEKVKVYDKGIVQSHDPQRRERMLTGYRNGDMLAPQLEASEALRRMAQEFVSSIMEKRAPLSDGHAGYRVVRLLEGAQRSIEENGRVIDLRESQLPMRGIFAASTVAAAD